MTAPEQPTPTLAAMALADRYVDPIVDEWRLALAIDELAAQRAAEAVDTAVKCEGGEWVTTATLDRLQQETADLQSQLDRMRQRYHAAIEEGMASENAVIVGNFTIDKLRRGETVEVNGIALIPADDLRDRNSFALLG